jgi:hypothetical protein
MEIHADLGSIKFLIGSWRGSGHGQYPTIEPFGYSEEVSYLPGPGKPFLLYSQRTRAVDGSPLHSEAGYVRVTAGGPELVIAQPTGLTEVHSGIQEGTTLEFRSVAMGATPTAKAVSEVTRRLVVSNDQLYYTLDMAYADVPLTLHLDATLQRVAQS